MLLRRSGQRVAHHPLQVSLQLHVTACDLIEEASPGLAITSRCGRGDFRHPVSTVVWTLWRDLRATARQTTTTARPLARLVVTIDRAAVDAALNPSYPHTTGTTTQEN